MVASKKHLTLKEIAVIEYAKCKKDLVYFCKQYCKIQNQEKHKLDFFLLYPFQEKVIQDFQNNRFVIINKSRQLGISTLVAVYALYKMTFNTDYNVLVIATA